MATFIGKVVKLLRVEKGLTQLELSQKAELSQRYVSEFERGRYDPSIKTLAKIAVALGVPLWEIIKKAEEREAEQNEQG